MVITVPSWSTYNPRRDVKHSTWFRMQHNFFESSLFYRAKPEVRVAWMYVLCECSKQNSSSFLLNLDHAADFTMIKSSVFLSAIKKLEELQILMTDDSETRNVHDTCAGEHVSLRTDGRTDERVRKVDLIDIWNANRGPLPEAIGNSTARRRMSGARWHEKPDKTYWENVVKRIAASPFCCGHNNTGWRASYDWFLKPDTHLRAMEGKYGSASSQVKYEEISQEELPYGN